MTRGEFIIPTTCGFATRGRNYTVPTPPPEGIEAILLHLDIRKNKLLLKSTQYKKLAPNALWFIYQKEYFVEPSGKVKYVLHFCFFS